MNCIPKDQRAVVERVIDRRGTIRNYRELAKERVIPPDQLANAYMESFLLNTDHGSMRLIRGGSWYNVAENLRSACRYNELSHFLLIRLELIFKLSNFSRLLKRNSFGGLNLFDSFHLRYLARPADPSNLKCYALQPTARSPECDTYIVARLNKPSDYKYCDNAFQDWPL